MVSVDRYSRPGIHCDSVKNMIYLRFRSNEYEETEGGEYKYPQALSVYSAVGGSCTSTTDDWDSHVLVGSRRRVAHTRGRQRILEDGPMDGTKAAASSGWA